MPISSSVRPSVRRCFGDKQILTVNGKKGGLFETIQYDASHIVISHIVIGIVSFPVEIQTLRWGNALCHPNLLTGYRQSLQCL